jgi:SAM-dependent methyltransferase
MFNNYSHYYDFFYQDKEYEKETAYIVDLLKKHEIQNGNILEFGSGTGKHGCLLCEKGYNVHGIELSAEMIAKAKTHVNFTCQQGDIGRVILDRSFNAVISLFHVISYQTKNSQIKAVFKNAADHLSTGGLFIFDIWYSPAVHYLQPAVRIKRFKNDQVSIVRIAEPNYYPNENLVDVNYTFFLKNLINNSQNQFKETHTMRHFSIPEIDFLADMYSFQRIEAHEFLTKKNPSENTWGICFTLKKK